MKNKFIAICCGLALAAALGVQAKDSRDQNLHGSEHSDNDKQGEFGYRTNNQHGEHGKHGYNGQDGSNGGDGGSSWGSGGNGGNGGNSY